MICGMKKVLLTLAVLCGKGGEVRCVCDRHNSFTLSGLDHGTYTFVFKVCGEERHRQEYTI